MSPAENRPIESTITSSLVSSRLSRALLLTAKNGRQKRNGCHSNLSRIRLISLFFIVLTAVVLCAAIFL